MMKFLNFFDFGLTESKFRDVPEQVVNQANKIADKYFKQQQTLTSSAIKQLKKIGLDSSWQEYFEDEKGEVWFLSKLTTIKFVDLSTNKEVKYNVLLAIGKNNENYAICDDTNKLIVIYDYPCRNLDRNNFVSVMVHEITHGFQQYKKYSDKYEKMKANKKSSSADLTAQYYKQSIEIDAFMTEIGHTIRSEFQQIQNDIKDAEHDIERSKFPETKKLLQRKVDALLEKQKKFLLELKLFITSPFKNYFLYKEIPLPYSLERFEEMMKFIHKSPETWKKVFKPKLNNLYNKLNSN
jgi:hypothetical protein